MQVGSSFWEPDFPKYKDCSPNRCLFSPTRSSSAHCLGRSLRTLITPFNKCQDEMLPGQGSLRGSQLRLSTPSSGNGSAPLAVTEPDNSSVGTGPGKNSWGGHIPASPAARHQQAHVEPLQGGYGGERWTQTKPSVGERPACCLSEAEAGLGGWAGDRIPPHPPSWPPRNHDRLGQGLSGSFLQVAENSG